MGKNGTTKYAQVLRELLSENNKIDRKDVVSVFSNLLVKHKKTHLLNSILDKYKEMVDEDSGTVRLQLTTARELSPEDYKKIEDKAYELFQAKKIIITKKIDEKIIGGWKLKSKDHVVDSSLVGRIERLKLAITK